MIILQLDSEQLKKLIRNEFSEAFDSKFIPQPPPKKGKSKYLTRKEAALKIRCSLPTLTKYIKQGKVTAHRIGSRVLIPETDLEQSIKNGGGK